MCKELTVFTTENEIFNGVIHQTGHEAVKTQWNCQINLQLANVFLQAWVKKNTFFS